MTGRMKMKDNQYNADLSINKYKIDKELLEQAQKYYDWAQAASIAEVEKDDAKDDYDLALIEIENKIRKDPKKYFEDRPTEGAIKAKIQSNPRVKEAYQKYRKARNRHKLISKAEKAFEQRKRMLESYLYHIHRGKESEVKVPREYEKQFNEDTRRSIRNQLSIKRRRT